MKSALGVAMLSGFLLVPIARSPVAAEATLQEPPLTNADIVKLTKSGLGDDVIIAKISQALSNFQLDPDNLIQLKEQGVAREVIEAMLKRAGQSRNGESPRTGARITGTPTGAVLVDTASPELTVVLGTVNGEVSLPSVTGASTTAGPFGEYHFLDYPEIRAEARTMDRHPSLLIRSAENPLGRIFIVRVDPDKGDRCRSLKIGHGGPFARKGSRAPDPDWTFSYDAAQSSPEIWRLELRKDLRPGEYGVFGPDGQLFAFGVDKARK